MEPVDVYSRWISECKKSCQGIYKKEEAPASVEGAVLDYEVPEDDAWQEKDEEDEDEEGANEDEEEEDGDFEPPAKKRNEDEDDELRKVQAIIGKDGNAEALLKEMRGADADSDDDDD